MKYCQLVQMFSILLFLFAMQDGLAEKPTEPVAQKEGINLFLWFADPLDAENSKILCELENTTDKNVIFELHGSAYKFPFVLHLFDVDGQEIKKTEQWVKNWENGFQRTTTYRMIPTGNIADRQTFDLREAYGDDWIQGVILKVVWNPDERRKGPGPAAGVFGVGIGLEGSIDVSRRKEKLEVNPSSGDGEAGDSTGQSVEKGEDVVLRDVEAGEAIRHVETARNKKRQAWVGIAVGATFLLLVVLLLKRRF